MAIRKWLAQKSCDVAASGLRFFFRTFFRGLTALATRVAPYGA
jgi:hypothetical protein